MIETSDEVMHDSAKELEDLVVGHRIVAVSSVGKNPDSSTTFTLDNGTRVRISDTWDCCAYTDLITFVLHADKIDHIITGVSTEDNYQKWHIFADMGDVLELTVEWSEGSGYYGYGFVIDVVPAD